MNSRNGVARADAEAAVRTLLRWAGEDPQREGLLDEATYGQLCDRYPTDGWDWRSLGRWFLIFGAISVMAGLWERYRKLFTVPRKQQNRRVIFPRKTGND